MTSLNLSACVIYTLTICFYLEEFFYGDMAKVSLKGIYYFVTGSMMLLVIVAELAGYRSVNEKRSNIILKFSIFINFLLFALMQLNLLPNPIMNTILINGCIFAAGIPILISGMRHGVLKD